MREKISSPITRTLFGLCLIVTLTLTLAACSGSPIGGTGASTPTAAPTATTQPTAVPTLPTVAAIPSVTVTNANQLLNTNLIANGNAETGPGSTDDSTLEPIPGWTRSNCANVVTYAGSGGDQTTTSPGPSDRGNNYFFGGTDSISPTSNAMVSSLSQTINVSIATPLFATGSIKYTISAWLGGYSSQNDNVKLTLQFLSITNQNVGNVTLGPVLSADRNDTSELVQRSSTGSVPVGTAQITVTLTFTRTDGTDNDASADDIALMMQS